jgi:hypothetical protein
MCTSEGAQGCIVNGSFAAAETTGLASKVLSTESVAGVTGNVALPVASDVARGVNYGIAGSGQIGTRFATKQCRNAGDLATWDSCGVSNLGIDYPSMPANGTNVLIATDELNWNPTTYHLAAAFPVQVTTTGTLPGGLFPGTNYYVIVSGTKIKLSASAGGAAIDLTSTGSGTIRLSVVPDGQPDLWDTIDDNNNYSDFSPTATSWSGTYLCDSTNFEDLSSTGGPSFTPSDTIPAGGTVPFSRVWRDKLSGVYFTNILYSGSTSTNWSVVMDLCSGLDSGDGPGNWHLPTQKELFQLYVNGISKVQVNGSVFPTLPLWSATAHSQATSLAWVVTLSDGSTALNLRSSTNIGAICVR